MSPHPERKKGACSFFTCAEGMLPKVAGNEKKGHCGAKSKKERPTLMRSHQRGPTAPTKGERKKKCWCVLKKRAAGWNGEKEKKGLPLKGPGQENPH